MYYFVKGAHLWRRKIGLKLFSQSRTAVRSHAFRATRGLKPPRGATQRKSKKLEKNKREHPALARNVN
jgi:hypothetical protein